MNARAFPTRTAAVGEASGMPVMWTTPGSAVPCAGFPAGSRTCMGN